MPRIDIYERYTSKAVAKARKEQIERNYPPQGYGTIVRVTPAHDFKEGCYVVEGYRYDTCD